MKSDFLNKANHISFFLFSFIYSLRNLICLDFTSYCASFLLLYITFACVHRLDDVIAFCWDQVCFGNNLRQSSLLLLEEKLLTMSVKCVPFPLIKGLTPCQKVQFSNRGGGNLLSF